jgi:hypothetical protein
MGMSRGSLSLFYFLTSSTMSISAAPNSLLPKCQALTEDLIKDVLAFHLPDNDSCSSNATAMRGVKDFIATRHSKRSSERIRKLVADNKQTAAEAITVLVKELACSFSTSNTWLFVVNLHFVLDILCKQELETAPDKELYIASFGNDTVLPLCNLFCDTVDRWVSEQGGHVHLSRDLSFLNRGG